MPLVRVQVRNEYGLGLPELYKEANREDPKAVLDGVAVAGLVGILRQLGDLAEFAAEVFHGVQEQVMATVSRSHKLVVRVHHIEAALPPLERTILAQRSHLHFAYTAGSQWHARIHNEQNHFIYNDLPRFIMDSYEECRDPPRLHSLDRFDTGGPGSCLKRYSDATFFRRASAGSVEANVAKVPRDKKVRRKKKKRAWQRNGEVACGSSISNYSGRMQFASQNVDEQTSPTQIISTFDVTLKSDIGDQSNSFDSRTGSGYIECVFHPSYSIKPEEQEPNELPSPRSNTKHNHTLDSAFVDEQSGVANDDSPPSSSQEQTGPSSSCVTWDEKTEIVEPMDQHYDHIETIETLPTNFSLDTQESEVNFRSIGEMDFEFYNENTPTSIPDGNQMEENDSEPDNYVDALNTIESESETDLDCQTKREVNQHLIFIDEVEDGIHGLKAHHSDHHPSTSESHTPVYDFSNKSTSQDKPDSVSLESFPHELKFSDPSNASVISYCGNADSLDGSNIGSTVSNLLHCDSQEPNLQAPMSDKIISSSRDSQKSPHELSRLPSVTIWTNGGLLGLEPSKPPDCSILNGVSKDSVTGIKDDTNSPSSKRNTLNGDGYAGNHKTLVKSSERTIKDSECSTSCHDDKEDVIPVKKTSWGFPPANLDAKLGLSGDSHHSNRFSHTNGHVLNETSPATPGTEQSVNQEDGEKTSRMFGLGNRLLVNGFRSKASVVQYENSVSASSNGVVEKKSKDQSAIYQAFSETCFKDHSGSGLPINSPSSSPPLQHMKISFQPVNGFETSKLSLKFPDRVHSHESCEDMFPSFQLVPEPSTPLQYNGSDSDDDTFCRSSPYMSDDCLSHDSESNSEQWESEEETPRNNDHELYDALCRISLSESVSSSHELEVTVQKRTHADGGLQSPYAENGVEPSQLNRFLDLPSYEKLNLNPLYDPESISEFDRKGLLESHFPKEPTPLPPPLPPLEWRVMKPHLDVEDNQDDVPEAPNHTFDMKLLESTISLQSKPSPVKQHQNIEETNAIALKNQQPEGKKLNEQKEATQATNGKGMDEKDDFLHQIRAKSITLRRTSIARSTSMPTPPANFKVTAILEKANAIRQAVGSDEEDDDTWSDT